ncbi:hypothetical protein GCM10010909_13030 [Acidocella aquatica]|uniref:Rhamnan synthesis protein F n=1 Tax=Acidocella aquatica TaxID=1922313 RepID=A0ABQ6A4P4_9PROT|nr:rhamnan synthesis F family protein [Acidocella aquatica]GLR66623.1 hypothetical protein GCM10010909_13030 [Acidocella aquatica]
MVSKTREFIVLRGAVYRVRPFDRAQKRGYMRMAFERPGTGQQSWFVPVCNGLDFCLRTNEKVVTVSIDPDEAMIEQAGFRTALIASVRRRFTRLRRSTLKFNGVEIFPEGPRKKTKIFGKLVRAHWHNHAFDSQMLRDLPKLVEGWPIGPDENPAPSALLSPGIAVALHLHYDDLWPEIETQLKRWNVAFTLFLSITHENPELVDRIQSAFPGSVVRVVENSGRDVRPFLLLLEEGVFDSFSLICKIHGKKSLGTGHAAIFGDLWRRTIFLDLISTDLQVRKILQLFEDDPQVGLIGPRRFHAISNNTKPQDLLGNNRPAAEAIAAKMGSVIRDNAFDFFEGTMFWVKPQALAPLRELRLSENAFMPEGGLIDGAVEHAIERLFNHTAYLAGFRVDDVMVNS